MNFKTPHIIVVLFLVLSIGFAYAQNDTARITNIKSQLDLLAHNNKGLAEDVKTEINVTNITLSNFLLALSEIHKLNISVAPELEQITIVNNFTNVSVADLLVFLCKEYQLTIDFTGNIIAIKRYEEPVVVEETFTVNYDPDIDRITINAKAHPLYDVFKGIMDATGKNLVFTPGMESKPLTVYFQNIPFDIAMDKLALGNDMYFEKTKDNFYVFEPIAQPSTDGTDTVDGRSIRSRSNTLNFKIHDKQNKLLEVDFVNQPIANIINEVSLELGVDVFTATPLTNAGNATIKASTITFDDLLSRIFETQSVVAVSQDANANRGQQQATQTAAVFTYKKEGNFYYFGTEDQLSLRKVAIVYLRHRSVELLADPEGNAYGTAISSTVYNNLNASNNSYNGSGFNNNTNNNTGRQQINNNKNAFDSYTNKGEALLSILPEELKTDLDIKVDFELNSFYVQGASEKVERFREFVNEIDKPIPVILIEVMIIEVNKNGVLETGISLGIGDQPVQTQGTVFPDTNLTIGADALNTIITGINGFTGFNLGPVGPNFYASIKAMEANGDLKVRSTPRLATLNSHRATFSNGQTSFYAVTQRNIYGTDNPQTSEITNYLPIDAELGLTIKPSVSGDGQVILDISVIQSSFGQRIADDAPPDINSRSFSSIIRMKDQDLAILGGLEDQMTNENGSGVPGLARVPVLKWFFSKRKREARQAKLTVLIKPTVIY